MTTTTTPATAPDRFPRYCSECGEGMRTGYQHEEHSGLTYCSLDCAADGLEMTTDELEEAYDNAVNGREAKRPSREALVTYEEWMDSPHEDFEAFRTIEPLVRYDAGEGCDVWVFSHASHFAVTLYDRDADILMADVRMFDTLLPAVLYAIDVATKSQALIQGSH